MAMTLGVVVPALIVAVAVQRARPDPALDGAPGPPHPLAATLPTSMPAIASAADRAAAIVARPLFAPSRRPDATENGVTRPLGSATLPRLAGIVVTPAARIALFAEVGAAHLLARHEGDLIGPFEIRAIAPGIVDAAGPEGLVRMRVSWERARPIMLELQPTELRQVPTAHSRETGGDRQE